MWHPLSFLPDLPHLMRSIGFLADFQLFPKFIFEFALCFNLIMINACSSSKLNLTVCPERSWFTDQNFCRKIFISIFIRCVTYSTIAIYSRNHFGFVFQQRFTWDEMLGRWNIKYAPWLWIIINNTNFWHYVASLATLHGVL